MENVPGILSSLTRKGEYVKDVVVSVAKDLGYNVHLMQLVFLNLGNGYATFSR